MLSLMFWSTMICWRLIGLSAQLTSSPNLLNGQHLRIIWPAWEGNPKGMTGPLKGGVIIDCLSARFNFTYEMVRVTEKSYEPTASGRGLFSYLLENKSDLLVDGVVPTSNRLALLDLTHPWSTDLYTALIPAAEIGVNINAVVKPFQWQVWLSLGISIVIVIFVLNRVHRSLESYFKEELSNFHAPRPGRRNKKAVSQYLYVFGNLLAQGGPCKFKRLSFRLVAGCWTLAAFVFVQAYTSTLFTYVVVPVSSPLINSVNDIAENVDVKLFIRKNSGINLIISNANHSTGMLKKLLERIDSVPNARCLISSECTQLVNPQAKNGKPYVLDAIKERYEKTGKCELQLSNEGLYNYIVVFALPKYSPYTPFINKGILNIQEMGLVDYWDTWFRRMPPKCIIHQKDVGLKLPSAVKSLSPLTIRNLTCAFVVLVVGYTVSTLFFLFEHLSSCIKRIHRKIKSRI